MVQLLALNFLAFLLAMSFGYALTLAARRARRSTQPRFRIEQGTPLRIRADQAVYRSRVLETSTAGLVFAAPLQRDTYVPLRIGERLVVEALLDGEKLLFHSAILNRDSATGQMTMEIPKKLYRVGQTEMAPANLQVSTQN